MFDQLPESRPPRTRSIGQTVAAAAVHLVLIAAAIKVTAGAAESMRMARRDTTIMFLRPPDPPPPPSHAPQAPAAATSPPSRGFQVVTPPVDVPVGLPPIDLTAPFDPRNYTGVGMPGGTADGVPADSGAALSSMPYSGSRVDEQARYVGGPDPKYPPALRAAGIEGRVVVRFVVGTDGAVEANSIMVIASTNAAFDDPAREAVAHGRFLPARLDRRAVRQLVEQAVVFRIR